MGNFSFSGGVEILGFISPTDSLDTYPVIDPLYGIDGFRNVDTLSDLNSIPNPRRRAGMVVGVSGGTTYYKLNPSPWVGNITDWTLFQIDNYVTGYTYQDNTFTIFDSLGNTFNANFNTVTGLTVNGNLTVTGNTSVQGLSATTISATTIGVSGDCVDDIYVSNIHSCSPLIINPLDEGNVYFGSTSGVTIDLSNNRVGIGTTTPNSRLQVNGQTTLVQPQGSDYIVFSSSTLANSGQTMYIRQTAANQYLFGSTGIGFFMRVGPLNVVDFEGQRIQTTGAAILSTTRTGDPNILTLNGIPSGVTAGTQDYRGVLVNPTVNFGGTYSGNFIGYLHNPTITSTANGRHIAMQIVSGDVLLNTTSGNVGIGTTTPSEKLNVSGNTRLDGNLTVTGNTTVGGNLTLTSSNVPPSPTVSIPFTDDYTRGTLSPGGTPSLTYTNTNTGAGNATIVTNYLNIVNGAINGQSYTTVPLSGFLSPFNTTLSSNNPLSTIEWTFNLRTNRNNILSGFGAAQYGAAVILAGTSATLQNTGNGYALVYGGSGTRNWRLVRYTGGLSGTITDIIPGGIFAANQNYVSVKIVYTPATNTWTYYFRDDGGVAWGDPTTVNTLIGSAVDSTYTSTLMSVFGVFFNYSTAANQNLQFDNLRVQQIITYPSTPIDEIIVKNYLNNDVFKVKDDGTTTMSGSVTSNSGFFGSFSGTHLGNGSALVLGQSGIMVSGTSQLNLTNATTALTLIPGLTTTITAGSQTMVYIQTNGGVNTIATTTNGGSALDIAIIVDGAVLPAGGYQRIYADNPTGNATVGNWVANWNTSVLVTLSAGTHTIEVDAVYVAGSNASVSGGAGAVKQGTLTVMVLKNI